MEHKRHILQSQSIQGQAGGEGCLFFCWLESESALVQTPLLVFRACAPGQAVFRWFELGFKPATPKACTSNPA